MRKVFVIIALFITVFVSLSFTNQPGYIRLEYIGASNKPLPTLVFYTDKYVDTTFGIALKYFFKVSKSEVNNMFQVISDYRLQESQAGPHNLYSFLAEEDGLKKQVKATTTKGIASLFVRVLAQLKDSATISQTKEKMNETLYRLQAVEWPIP